MAPSNCRSVARSTCCSGPFKADEYSEELIGAFARRPRALLPRFGVIAADLEDAAQESRCQRRDGVHDELRFLHRAAQSEGQAEHALTFAARQYVAQQGDLAQ